MSKDDVLKSMMYGDDSKAKQNRNNKNKEDAQVSIAKSNDKIVKELSAMKLESITNNKKLSSDSDKIVKALYTTSENSAEIIKKSNNILKKLISQSADIKGVGVDHRAALRELSKDLYTNVGIELDTLNKTDKDMFDHFNSNTALNVDKTLNNSEDQYRKNNERKKYFDYSQNKNGDYNFNKHDSFNKLSSSIESAIKGFDLKTPEEQNDVFKDTIGDIWHNVPNKDTIGDNELSDLVNIISKETNLSDEQNNILEKTLLFSKHIHSELKTLNEKNKAEETSLSEPLIIDSKDEKPLIIDGNDITPNITTEENITSNLVAEENITSNSSRSENTNINTNMKIDDQVTEIEGLDDGRYVSLNTSKIQAGNPNGRKQDDLEGDTTLFEEQMKQITDGVNILADNVVQFKDSSTRGKGSNRGESTNSDESGGILDSIGTFLNPKRLIGSFLGSVKKIFSSAKFLGPVAAAAGGYAAYNTTKASGHETLGLDSRKLSGGVGAGAGALVGATIGSAIPVVGTIIGGAIGTAVGGYVGAKANDLFNNGDEDRVGISSIVAAQKETLSLNNGINTYIDPKTLKHEKKSNDLLERMVESSEESLGVQKELGATAKEQKKSFDKMNKPKQNSISDIALNG